MSTKNTNKINNKNKKYNMIHKEKSFIKKYLNPYLLLHFLD